MLKLKLQCFGHLQIVNSLEKADSGKDWRPKEKRWQRMRWLDSIMTQWTRKWRKETWSAVVHGVAVLGTTQQLNNNIIPRPKLFHLGFPGGSVSKESACNMGDLGLIPGLGRFPGWGHGNPFQYSCLENPQEQSSLMGCSPWGRKESDATKWLSTAQAVSTQVNIFGKFRNINFYADLLKNLGCVWDRHVPGTC